jgi:phospholipid/cholesterol/gamma-HCH transport system substrate-binding protein
VLDITRDFKFLSKTMVRGKGTLGAFLTDSVMAANVKATVVNLDKASQNAIRITAAVNQLIAKMNTKGGLADNLFTDTTVFNDIKTAVNQLNQATATASEITSNLKQTTDKLNASNNAVGVLLNDEQAATRIRNTLGNLESSSKKLDEDLEALQHNFLLKGFFKKKEKAEAEAAKP